MKILFVGAGGSGMGALVRWHRELGDEVYLQDDALFPADLLQKHPGSFAFSIDQDIALDRAVFSDAIAPTHPLRTYASKKEIPIRSYAEELGALSQDRHVIAIAGTHGKSTTTALISWALAAAEQDPLCVIGAEILPWKGGFRFGKGPVVVEADEFRKHFLHLSPSVILITSLEADHFDTYADEDELVKTFLEFCCKKSVKAIFIARGTLALDRLSEELSKIGRSHVRFGSKDDVVHSEDFTIVAERSHLTVSINTGIEDIDVQSVACPHISNILGAIAVLIHEAVPVKLLKQGIGTFPGILRRLELLGRISETPLYSDYAHHPTAVRETLRMLRKIFPNAQIGVIFEPHERLRTSALRDEYQNAFADAQSIALLPVYDPIGRQRPDILDSAISLSPAGDTTQLGDYATAFAWAQNFAKKNGPRGILVIMGAGPIDGAFRKFLT